MNLLAPSPGYTQPDPDAGWFGLLMLLGCVIASGVVTCLIMALLFRWIIA